MDPSFGARLRLHRERQQIPLSTIAERTKIKLSLLEALERDDVSHWPHGIFGRSYIRSYAEAVGLDPAATVRAFAECFPFEPVQAPLAELGDISSDRANRRPPMRLQFLIDSAIDAFHAKRAELNQKFGADGDNTPSSVVAPVSPDASPAGDPPGGVDFLTLAKLCTRLACAREAHELTSVLEDAAGVFDAVGVILWIPDRVGVALTCAFAHGYPDQMIAQLPSVPGDAHNAIAEAFRTRSICVVNAAGADNGAVVAPLLTPAGCAGVLSVELRDRAEQREDVRAAVMILAAQVSTLMEFSVLAHTRSA